MPARRNNGRASVVCSMPCQLILMWWAQWMKAERGVDEAVVDRLTCGSPVDSIKSERLEATRILSHWGHSMTFIAERLHVSQRSIVRYRHDLLLQEGVQL
jgi:hypothetical protein